MALRKAMPRSKRWRSVSLFYQRDTFAHGSHRCLLRFGSSNRILDWVNRMKISARNVLNGKVVSINDGAVNSEVIVRLAGGDEIVSIVTKASVKHLALAPGKEVHVVIKASNVMLAVD